MLNREMNNVVVIGSRDKREVYVYSILLRMKPRVYNLKKHMCIIIKVRESLLEFAETIIKGFKWAGLVEVSRKRKPLKNEDAGYTLPNGYEIVLKKIPPLELMEEEN